VWLDLLEPTPAEEKRVEEFLAIDVPTREEMREIETSNRLYEEDGTLYLTATVITKLDTVVPENAQITFILAGHRLVTNRYIDPLPVRRFVSYAERHPETCQNGAAILAGLLESIVNRMADALERSGADLDLISSEVFAAGNARTAAVARDFRVVLERVGRCGDVISKTREALASLGRLLVFVQQQARPAITPDVVARFRTVTRDTTQMNDHAAFLSNKVQFTLDATLGMINIDQNNILKIFSLVTVFLLPPSLIAAIFGMNFTRMPWLHSGWGFAAAVGLMLAASILPFAYFKRRRWL
jgi:magnesium transporter